MYEGKAYEEANVFPGEYYLNDENGICYKILSKKELENLEKIYDCNKYIYYLFGKDKNSIENDHLIDNIAKRKAQYFIHFVKIASSPSVEIKTKCPKCGGKMEYVNMAEKCESCWWVKQ